MASLTIRNLDERLKARLRVRAAQHGSSMEEEAREILRIVLTAETVAPRNLARAIRGRFAKLEDVDLTAREREPVREPPHLD